MRAYLIINPISGDSEPNEQKVALIQRILAPAGIRAEIAYTSPRRSAAAWARQAVAQRMDAVIVGGGDGTVSQVANELIGTPVTLGILPIGTFNNMARSIGALVELPEACRIIVRGHKRRIDAGQANGGRYFFEAAGAGLDATLFPLGEQIKGGRWSRIWNAAKLTLQYQPQRFELELDRPLSEAMHPDHRVFRAPREMASRLLHRRALFVAVANGPYYGGGFTVADKALLDDGLLTVNIYARFSKWELLRHFRSISRGKYHYSPNIEVLQVRALRLSSRADIPVHVDGEPAGELPFNFRAIPGALRVFAPKVVEQQCKEPIALPVPAERKRLGAAAA